jgi:hypothetical protein
MDQGLLYLAKGETFVAEAVRSARRASTVMPDHPVTLVADREPDADCFDDVVLDTTPFEKRDKPRALLQTPYDRTIYLDTDTYLADSVAGLYDLLGEFGVGVRRNRDQAHVPDDSPLPRSFPEFNCGVIAYETNDPVTAMLRDWEERCLPTHEFDQRSFREALFHSDVRFTCIPNRFNCMYRYDNVVDGPVKVFHGPLVDRERNSVPLPEAVAKLNDSHDFRLYYAWRGRLFVDPAPPIWTKAYRTARRDGLRALLAEGVTKLRRGLSTLW